ncbi:hypothetical protein [Nesterenkonia xinjiangensis]|uniref:DUF4352 domain-containing protein n=1 Tax=Nesterenkonia xinjiangensis TaxID=225327 RepID=A0A7Z0GLP7_9MICC|nr:hypothetical protein [Nesterenkonia xinjiangensis]NYJ78300.1 hypothetical protein [Nesterenkonia xinjiangensis]
MRGTTITGLGLVGLLALAGCGDNTDPVTEAEPEQEETASEAEPAVEEDAEEVESEADEDVAPKDRDFSDDPILEDHDFTGRMTGDVTAHLGDPVEIDQGVFEGLGDYVGTVTMTELVPGDRCYTYDDESADSQNGFIVYATFLLEADGEEELDFNDGDFRWGGSDVQIATSDTWECMDYLNGATDSVRVGESRERIYVFDVPDVDGTLVYAGGSHYVDWEIERDDFGNAERIP